MSRLRSREPKQRHLSGGVKAQPEQETERRHLPAMPKQRKERPKQTRQRAAAAQENVEIISRVPASLANGLEALPNSTQYQQIHRRNGEQKGCRGCGRDHTADLRKTLKARQRAHSERDESCRNQHDRGVPERKEKTVREWPFAVLNQFSGYIVDGGDVICINRMAQSQAVGKYRGAQLHRVT